MPPKQSRRANKNSRQSNLQAAHTYFTHKKESIHELMNKSEYVKTLDDSLAI